MSTLGLECALLAPSVDLIQGTVSNLYSAGVDCGASALYGILWSGLHIVVLKLYVTISLGSTTHSPGSCRLPACWGQYHTGHCQGFWGDSGRPSEVQRGHVHWSPCSSKGLMEPSQRHFWFCKSTDLGNHLICKKIIGTSCSVLSTDCHWFFRDQGAILTWS